MGKQSIKTHRVRPIRKYWVPLLFFGLTVLFWLIQSQVERMLKQDIEEASRFFIETPLSIQDIQLGFHTTEFHLIEIPNVKMRNSNSPANSIELEKLNITVPLWTILQRTIIIDTIHLSGLTLYWDGITGQNVQFIIQQLKTSLPRKSKRRNRQHEDPKDEGSLLQINRIVVEDIAIKMNIHSHTKEFLISELVLYDVTGNSEGIVQQILEQVRSGFHNQYNHDIEGTQDIQDIDDP